MNFLNNFASVITVAAMATVVGFLAIPPLAAGLNAIESARCPGRTRVQVVSIGDSWGKWGACLPE